MSYGAIQALAGVLASAFSGTADEMRGRAIWLQFGTMLNYFLAKDIADFSAAKQSAVNPPSG